MHTVRRARNTDLKTVRIGANLRDRRKSRCGKTFEPVRFAVHYNYRNKSNYFSRYVIRSKRNRSCGRVTTIGDYINDRRLLASCISRQAAVDRARQC